MSLQVKNDETIQVGVTPGLVAGASSFTFDGTETFPGSGIFKPDYRYYEPVFSEIGGRSPMIKGVDYSWDYTTGVFTLLSVPDIFADLQYYNVHFQAYSVAVVSPSSIIDYSFFIRKINIPNIDPTRYAPGNERLNSFIGMYEPRCLRGLLGYALYQAFVNENSSRMNDLLYGVEYTDKDGILQKWRGFVYEPRISLIANYIYVKYQEDAISQSTGVSTSVNNTPDGNNVTPADKIIDAWNLFSSESKELISFLWNKNIGDTQVYPEFTDYTSPLYFSKKINYFGI